MSSDVRRPKQFEEMLRKLCQEEDKIFLTYKDGLVFAACLGFCRGKRQPFDKSSEPVGLHIFKGDYDAAIFNCIGLSVTTDPHIMGSDREVERIRIFEEFACGGLEIIEEEIYKGAGSWDQLMLSLVASQAKPESSVFERYHASIWLDFFSVSLRVGNEPSSDGSSLSSIMSDALSQLATNPRSRFFNLPNGPLASQGV